jgi:capsular polysaccharide biosynthesis protein
MDAGKLPSNMGVPQDDRDAFTAPSPPVSLTRAMLWNWWLVLICVLLCAGVGAAAGLIRSPEYTATAKLAVGRIDITSPGALSGFPAATQALATGYSRTVTSRAVAEAVSKRTGISVDEVQHHVLGTPIAESPIFRIEATSPNSDQAIELANASSRALIVYVTHLNRSDPDSRRLYRSYRAAVLDRKAAKRQLKIAEANAEQRPISAAEEEIDFARAELAAATLRVEAVGHAYTTSIQNQAATQLIQVISPADEASSDRRSTFLIYTFIGFVIGLLVGGALAFFRESRLQTSVN